MALLQGFRDAATATGRPLLALLWEALQLRMSSSRLGASEYLDFQLYLRDLSFSEKRCFAGFRAQAVLEELLVDDYSRFLSLDKVSMYALMRGFGLPIPEVKATYLSRRPAAVRQLQTPIELANYLRAAPRVYLKRSFGSYGRGNTVVEGVDGETVLLGSGERERLETFVASLDNGRGLGWILQDPLRPHQSIEELTGSSRVSGLRIHTFQSGRGPVLTRAIFKVNVGRKDSDNFEHGKSGNLLGAVDLKNGRVRRVISGVGAGQAVDGVHPVSGKPITNFELPHWNRVVDLVKDAQNAFPGFLCPGWDIAICDNGPRILEVNAFGDVDLSQHAYRAGFVDDEFVGLLLERNLASLLGRIGARRSRSSLNNRVGLRRHHWSW